MCLTQWASPSCSLAEALIVASTSVPVLTRIAFALSWAVIASNSALSSPRAASAVRKRTNAVRSGVLSRAENPQNRRNDERPSSASASLTSERSYHTVSSIALNRATGGQAGSPFAALAIPASCCLIGIQSISFAKSSNDEPRAVLPSPNPKLS